MSDRVEKALELHKKGYNCAQAVACAYCDLFNMDEQTAFKAAEGYGAGMGGMQATCGAVSGAVMLAGLKNSSGDVSDRTKGSTYKISRKIVADFEQKNGSTLCKELKGIETKKVLRSCDGCIEDASRLVEQILLGD